MIANSSLDGENSAPCRYCGDEKRRVAPFWPLEVTTIQAAEEPT